MNLNYDNNSDNNNNNNNNNNHNIIDDDDDDDGRPVVIRHAGRAHIRGKIRRIWRPRYLEVMDSGLVRYYECSDDATTNNGSDAAASSSLAISTFHPPNDYYNNNNKINNKSNDEHHLHMIPKCTLQVYRARIIDVTTLRDVHVGLPHGTFGFLFHARRLLYHDDNPIVVCTPDSQKANQPARDFLCAVSTLEEAQSWVVALQWASWYYASGHRHNSTNSQGQENVDLLHDDDLYSTAASTVAGAASSPRRQPALVVVTRPRKKNKAIATKSRRGGSRSTTTTRNNKSMTNNKIVVPKVQSVRLVLQTSNNDSDGNWSSFTMAYQIQLLLLTENTAAAGPIEERVLLRTRSQLALLLKQMEQELSSSSSVGNNNNNTSSSSTIAKSKRILESVRVKLTRETTNFNNTYRSFVASIPCIGSILRTLAMDAQLCNSTALRTFWSLDDVNPIIQSSLRRLVLLPPQPRGIASPPIHHNVVVMAGYSTTDDFVKGFVKQWVKVPPPNKSSISKPTKFIYNRLIQLSSASSSMMGTVVMGCLVIVPLVLVRRPLPYVVVGSTGTTNTIHLSLDILLLSWVVAVLVGREWEKRRRASSDKRRQQQQQQRTVMMTTSRAKSSATTKQPKAPSKRLMVGSSSTDNAGGTANDDEELFLDVQSASTDEEAASLDGDDDGGIPSSSSLDHLPSNNDDDDDGRLSSPLPQYPANGGTSCWSKPLDNLFRVRSITYLKDRVKLPSGPAPFHCRGVDLWLTDNPERHIARHPSVMGGRLEEEDTFLVNFLLPFGNFVAYFGIPSIDKFPNKEVANVWTKFINGDQQYRDARLKLLPVVVEGPWIVKAAVGPGTSPALLGKVIPLQYYFRHPSKDEKTKGIYEVDVIITASTIAKGILSVVKGHTQSLSIAFGFIIEAAEEEELPETVLCNCQIHAIDLERCPQLPHFDLDGNEES
eukprot:CAMPEP_0119010850 /NCGR_PEP_ID=MMETSP1176-20130426/5288_1 /TAXON_ID=265551 /ORGANISM="Synedropsis recta cf, Strain CCMP1620" /LENGTH=941 /DNA_ID=CAMNT_0006963591 /DNA_START=80 /DNA_END=2905 /DNA_ORIENTATION=-